MKDFLQEQIVHIVMGITDEHRLRCIYKAFHTKKLGAICP